MRGRIVFPDLAPSFTVNGEVHPEMGVRVHGEP